MDTIIFAVILATIILNSFLESVVSQGSSGIVAPPFFVLCNYHGQSEQSDFDSGEVAVSVSIEGDPEFYVPGQMYPGKFLITNDRH